MSLWLESGVDMRREKQSSFVKNAAILSFAGIFSRMLGAIYRIPLYRLISSEGMGLFSMGYNVYAMLLAISATGIPVAISKLVAEETSRNRMGEARRIFKVAAILLTAIGFVVTLGLIFTAPVISKSIIKEPRAVYPLIAVAPAIFIVALMASFRGFFQGLQLMWPTAISQITEQIGRIVTVLILAWYMVSIDARIELTAAAASFGSAVGSLVGLVVILLIYFKYKPYIKKLTSRSPRVSRRTNKQLIKRILWFAIPITIGAMVIPLMNGIDTVLVPRGLQVAGFTKSESTAMYGDLTSVVPLINLPSMLAYALAASLVPAISTASSEGKWKAVRSRSSLAIKLILLIGLPAAAGLSLLAKPITLMLYDTVIAAPILEILAFAVAFLTLHQACSGSLQGLGHTGVPVKNLMIGGAIKIVLNLILPTIPTLNIRGAAIASVVAYVVASILNVRSVCKHTGLKVKWSNMIIKPLIATGIMAIFVAYSYNYLAGIGISNTIATLVSVTIGMGFYAIGVLVTKCFSESELNSIPYVGPTIIKIAGKLRLLRRD